MERIPPTGTSIPGWLELQCPECGLELDLEKLSCRRDHRFGLENEVLSLLDANTRKKLEEDLARFEKYRAKKGLRAADPETLLQLPYGAWTEGSSEWRLRRSGWEMIQKELLSLSGVRILEFGAWNGWLSHRLTRMGHQVIAVDYFTDPLDGLGAVAHHEHKWTAIQMDLERPELFSNRFDLVIVNHCLQFFERPLDFLERARTLLRPRGRFLLLGLAFYSDPRLQMDRIAAAREEFLDHGFDFLKPVRGYLDFGDRESLLRSGYRLQPNRHFWKANLRSRWDRTRPRYELAWSTPTAEGRN